MQNMEISRKIGLSVNVDAETLKRSLVETIEKSMTIENISDGTDDFLIKATTGANSGFIRQARVEMKCNIDLDEKKKTARIVVFSSSAMARSLIVFYMVLFCVLLLIGLLPGSIETSMANSGSIDALVFIVLGIFIDYDVNKKLLRPRQILEDALMSVETKFG